MNQVINKINIKEMLTKLGLTLIQLGLTLTIN